MRLNFIFSALLPLCSIATTTWAASDAIKISAELRNQAETQSLIKEYESIAARNPICADKKNFGIKSVRIDGQQRARYYVDGKGISCIPSRLRPVEAWQVKNIQWSAQDESAYETFIQTIGLAIEEGKCSSVDSCMISSANPLRTQGDLHAFHYSDCADYPYYLRAYFAFRKSLGFTFASSLDDRPLTQEDNDKIAKEDAKIHDLESRQAFAPLSMAEQDQLKVLKRQEGLRGDPRYTLNGNWVSDRQWIVNSNEINFFGWVPGFQSLTSTATLRMWRNEGLQASDPRTGQQYSEMEPDFYSPRLDAYGIRPGTVVYKTDGHTGVVYRIDYETGKIYLMDAHPDNSISHSVLDETWTRNMSARPTYGGGFKNFRPIVTERSFFGQGAPRLKSDKELGPYFSYEQYEKFTTPDAKVMYNEKGLKGMVNYIDFLRLRLSDGRYRLDPATQFKDDLSGICKSIKYRREAVLEATEKGFHLVPHPEKLPDNIFGANGDWEKYSTPGSDVVFKQRVLNLVSNLSKYKAMVLSGHPLLKPGMTVDVMKSQLLSALSEVGNSCIISYQNSRNAEVSFNLLEAIKRAPYMSFDPYLCPERRFGASNASELSTCTDTADKTEWYQYEQFLRNRTEKTPGEAMGWGLQELKQQKDSSNVSSKLINGLDIEKAIRGL